jgi:6,7-dimethyl-8-ribityllumazine synthase
MRLTDDSNSNLSLNGKGHRFAVVVSRFNATITEKLLSSCLETLVGHGVRAKDVRVIHVPGSFELPLAAQRLAETRQYGAIITLGCIIRGETPHDRYISQETARGLGQAALNTGVPMIFGVLTPLNLKQAQARAGRGPLNKGREAALAALEMAGLMSQLKKKKQGNNR